MQRILSIYHTLSINKVSVIFIWAPSHIGLDGSDKVDRAAKIATKLPKITNTTQVPASDLKIYYKNKILVQWETEWKNQTMSANKLLQIKPFPRIWSSSNRKSRHEEIVITRLRIGHTKLTHSYILARLFPPSCPKCDSENLDTEHLFNCPQLTHLRSQYRIPNNRKQALSNSSSRIDQVILYLRAANLYNHI